MQDLLNDVEILKYTLGHESSAIEPYKNKSNLTQHQLRKRNWLNIRFESFYLIIDYIEDALSELENIK